MGKMILGDSRHFTNDDLLVCLLVVDEQSQAADDIVSALIERKKFSHHPFIVGEQALIDIYDGLLEKCDMLDATDPFLPVLLEHKDTFERVYNQSQRSP